MPSGFAPDGRTRFRRRGDYVAVVLIVVLTVLVSTVVWLGSDLRATTSRTNSGPPGVEPLPALSVPETVRELWRAPSGATPHPVAAGPNVVTANGGTVLGHDPRTGAERWSYRRDLPLCTVDTAFARVLTVYRREGSALPEGDRYHGGNCSEVTALNASTGARQEQRNGNAERGTRLVVSGSYVTATGRRLIDTWRSDLVLASEYGDVPNPRNPDRQPHPDCVYGSVANGNSQVGVVQRCPDEERDRLVVYAADNPDDGDDDRPSVRYSVLLPTDGRIVAMNERAVAVAVPNPARLLLYPPDSSGQPRTVPLDVPNGELTGDPEGAAVSLTPGSRALYWYTGSRLVALSPRDLRPMWTMDSLGQGTDFGGETLVPVPRGLAVVDPGNGTVRRTISVDRGGHRGTVDVGASGTVVLEQRGRTLVALG